MRFPLGLFGGQESEQGLQESCLKQGDPQLVLRHDGSGRATGVIRFKPIGRDGSQHRVWKRQRNLEKWWQEADVEGSFTQSKATASTPRNALEFPVGLNIGLRREYVRSQRRIRRRRKQNIIRSWRYIMEEERRELKYFSLQRHWKLWKTHMSTNKASVALAERFYHCRIQHQLRESLLWWQQQAQYRAYRKVILSKEHGTLYSMFSSWKSISQIERDSKDSLECPTKCSYGEQFDPERTYSQEDTVAHKISERFSRRKVLCHFLRQWSTNTLFERPWEADCVKCWRNRRILAARFQFWIQSNQEQKDALKAASNFQNKKIVERVFQYWMGLLMSEKLHYGAENVSCEDTKNAGKHHMIKRLSDWRLLQQESALLESWAVSWHLKKVLRNVLQHWGGRVLHGCQEVNVDRMIIRRQIHIKSKSFRFWMNNTREKQRQRLLVDRFQERYARLLARKTIHGWQAAWHKMVMDRSSNFRAEGHFSRRLISSSFRKWSNTSRQNRDNFLIARLCSGMHTKTITKKALRSWKNAAARRIKIRSIICCVEKKRVSKVWAGWKNVKDVEALRRINMAASEKKAERFRSARILRKWKAGAQLSIQHFSKVVESFRGRLLTRRCLRALRDSAKVCRKVRDQGQKRLLRRLIHQWSLSVTQTKSFTLHLQKVFGQSPQMIQSRCLYTWRTALEQARERELKDEERASKQYSKKLASNACRGWLKIHRIQATAEKNRRDQILCFTHKIFSSWRNQSYRQFHRNSHALLEQVQQKLHSLPPISSAASTAHSQASSVRSSTSEPLSQIQNRSLPLVSSSHSRQTSVDRNPPL